MTPFSSQLTGVGYVKTSYSSPGVISSVDGTTYATGSYGRGYYLSSMPQSGRISKPLRPKAFWFEKGDHSGHLYGKVYTYFSSGGQIVTDGYGPGQAVLTSNVYPRAWASDPYNRCLTKLYSKLRSDVDLSIDLYQGNQTLRMLRDYSKLISHPIRTIVSSTQKLVRGRKGINGLKLSASKWLEYQYGIRPSIDTIYTLTHDMIGAATATTGFPFTKARASSVLSDAYYLGPGAIGNYYSSNVGVNHTLHDSRRVEIGLKVRIMNEHLNALSQFTSLNPISFAWENLPFSFVADWVFDVGSYLRNLETALMTGLEFAEGYQVTTRAWAFSVKMAGGSSQFGTYYYDARKGYASLKRYDRIVLSTLPLPRPPTLEVHLGTERLLSAAALLSNLLKR